MGKDSGKVNIHGKEYKTVALRVQEFREKYDQEYGIQTELVSADEQIVIMKAYISDKSGFVLGSGYAEEDRSRSQINRTSALENCETSAIGRALAACGFAGTEYASANEVQNAIHQQETPVNPVSGHRFKNGEKEAIHAQVRACLEIGDEHGLKEIFDEYGSPEEKMKVWGIFNSEERSAIKELLK